MGQHILVVDDNKALCNTIADQLEDKYVERYSIDRFFDAKEAINYINTNIDPSGDKLVLVASDERLIGMQGHEFMATLTKTHPKTKKIIFSAWSDVNALKSGIDSKIDGFISKADQEHAGDKLFNLIDKLIEEYEAEPKLSYTIDGITFKQADTLYEKYQFFKRRYEIYLRAGHKTKGSLAPEQVELEMEWDDYDKGGVDALILTPETRYLLALKKGECIGGLRIIDGRCPLETGICLCDCNQSGFRKDDSFNLNHLRKKNIYTREISRLIVDEKYRGSSAVVLMGLFRIIEQLTSEQNTMFCTSKEKQIGLYQAIGFEVIGPKIKYSLDGEWIPLMRNRWKAFNKPEEIEGMCVPLHQKSTEPFPVSDLEKWNDYSRTVNEEAIKRGLYSDDN